MEAMYLVVAAVVGLQQPVVPPQAVEALARAQAALAAAQPTMARLGAVHGLDAQLATLGAVLAQDDQDPTDSLWRAARRALPVSTSATAS